MRCVIYNVVEFETSVFDRRYENDKQAFFKNYLHAGGRFWKDALSVTVFTQYVWTVDQTGGEKNRINLDLRFQTKSDTCGRSPKNQWRRRNLGGFCF